MTGTAVNRSKKEVWWSKRGNNLGACVFPCTRATIANTEHIATNATARRVDIAELNFKDSGKHQTIAKKKKKQNVSRGLCMASNHSDLKYKKTKIFL